MRVIKIILLFIIPFAAVSQQNEKGINFIHNKTWNEIKKQAKKEKKFIFVDCFTTWCGPCKFMSKTTFTNDSVGEFMNKNFLSYKAQIDTSAKDNDDIKKSYADFASINKQFDIQVYPTLIYLSPNGEIVHKVVGAMPAEQFIEVSKKALNPETQYYSLLKKFTSDKNDPELLKKLMTAAGEAYDDATPYFEAYVKTQNSMFTKENIEYIKQIGRAHV